MDVVGIGVDLVEVERIQDLLTRRAATFPERVFTPSEIAYCSSQASPAACYAARWAAREACRKSLSGVDGMRWKDVRVERSADGVPRLALSGAARKRAEELGVSEVMVSLTHERATAAAFCMAVRTVNGVR